MIIITFVQCISQLYLCIHYVLHVLYITCIYRVKYFVFECVWYEYYLYVVTGAVVVVIVWHYIYNYLCN